MEKIENFEKEFRSLSKLVEKQKLQAILEKKKDILFLNDRNLRCIDEGTPGGLHLAGSGVLVKDKSLINWDLFDGIYFHQECGAINFFIKENNLEENPDEFAEKFTKDLAKTYGKKFLGKIDLKRPKHFHNALGIWICGLPGFDFSKEKSLPPGFIINPFIVKDLNYTLFEINLALNIIENNGFGKFLKDEKFYLWFINENPKRFEKNISSNLNLEIMKFNL